MKLLTLRDLKLSGKKVFCRVDFNVVAKGKIIDEFRIEAAVPTIEYLLDQNCAVILASHNGRPEGKPNKEMSLEPVAAELANILDRPVHFMHDCVGEEVAAAAERLKQGQILLLENLRFHPEEEAGDEKFAHELANLAEVYVDDAFANVHRAHASMVGTAKLLPHAAGLLVEEEYKTLHGLLEKPTRPFTAIIGGAKVSDKLEVLKSLIKKVDTLVIAGAMANTFLYAQGHSMGKSVMEKDLKKEALHLLELAKKAQVDVCLPVDLVVAKTTSEKAKTSVAAADKCSADEMALDIGPASVADILEVVAESKTVFWNGTLGYAEVDHFAHASYKLAHNLARGKVKTIIGGGDTASFIDAHGMHQDFDFVSTGGGASLELLAGKELPAIAVLAK